PSGMHRRTSKRKHRLGRTHLTATKNNRSSERRRVTHHSRGFRSVALVYLVDHSITLSSCGVVPAPFATCPGAGGRHNRDATARAGLEPQHASTSLLVLENR